MIEFYKLKRLICLITAFILCFGLAACNGTDNNENPDTTPETPQIEDTDIYLVQNSRSDYKVVVEDGASSILLDAVRDVILFLKEASGAKLELKYQSSITYSSSSKLIVFGCDTLCEAAGVSLGNDVLGDSGYRMVTKDKSVFVMAQSVYGLKNGAYDFLSYQINWEIYSADMIYYAKSSNFLLKNFNISDKPDFEFRRSGDLIANDARRRMKFDSTIFAVDNVHTGFIYLPKATYQAAHPDWYANNGLQLCFTAHGNTAEYQLMQETMLQNILVHLDKNPDVNTVIIGQEDESRWCGCDECTASFAKYKTDSAVMVKFTNDISERLENYYKENNIIRNVKFCVFSYQNTVNAPVIKNTETGSYEPIDQSVVCRDNVGVYYAPMYVDYTESFYSEGNTQYREQVEGWAACTDELYLFLYGTYFWNYLLPFNNYYAVTETYRYFYGLGSKYYFELRQHNNSSATAFSKLKTYIEYKMLWDVNLNYNAVLDKFFDGYFGPAASIMRRYFNELTTYLDILAYKDGSIKGIWGPIDTPDKWSYGSLIQWEGYITEAYKAIEACKTSDAEMYRKLYDNICLESVFVRYALIEFCYGNYSPNELLNKKLALKEDMNRLGVNRAAENKTASDLMKEWGVG